MKYRKRPVVIEAIQWTGKNRGELEYWFGNVALNFSPVGTLTIATLEGIMKASVGDYIIKGVHGELYPCKPDIFEETYEAVE